MKSRHIQPDTLRGKIIDCHSHLGVALKAYACLEYPYAQTLEGLYYRQRVCGVDVSVVFPFSPDLYFEPGAFSEGEMRPASQPLSPAPYAKENEMVFAEVFMFCPEHQSRFLPFVSVDPGRDVAGQISGLLRLEQRYPIYGIKISPVACQSKIASLLEQGADFLDYARERNIPFLIHTTCDPREGYSHASDVFRVIDGNPDLRVCLAHCIGFDQAFLRRADETPNTWVDTSALKIQVQLAREESPFMAGPRDRIDADFSDHRKVMRALAEQFPDTIVWGSDSPAYSYICRRQQAEGVFAEFRLKGNYEDEKSALDALPPHLRLKVSNTNSLRFLFG